MDNSCLHSMPTAPSTATTFDYESNASTYSIRVQVRDEYNATAEGIIQSLLSMMYTRIQTRISLAMPRNFPQARIVDPASKPGLNLGLVPSHALDFDVVDGSLDFDEVDDIGLSVVRFDALASGDERAVDL